MKKYRFSIDIKAPVQKVWSIMIADESYRKWTAVFNAAGSRFEGDWSQGSEMRFLGPDPKNSENIGGMLAVIVENRPFEYISIKHHAEIINGQINEKAAWTDAYENYTFSENNGTTTLHIDLDMNEEYADYLSETRPKALQILKELSESI